MKTSKLLQKLYSGSKNVKFSELVTVVEAFGFRLSRINGSHHIYESPDMKDYHINIFYSEEDEGYIADIPDLKYCSAFGETPEQALKEVMKAKQAWLETAKASNKPIPLPLYRPIIDQKQQEAMAM